MSVQVSLVGCDTIAPVTIPTAIGVSGNNGSVVLGSTDSIILDGSCGVKTNVAKVGTNVTVGLSVPSAVSRVMAGWAESWDQLPVCRTDGGVGLPPAKGSIVAGSVTNTNTAESDGPGPRPRPEATVVQNIFYGTMNSIVTVGGYISLSLTNGTSNINGNRQSNIQTARNGFTQVLFNPGSSIEASSLSAVGANAKVQNGVAVSNTKVFPSLASMQTSALTITHHTVSIIAGDGILYVASIVENLQSA